MNKPWLRVLLGLLVLGIWGAVIARALRHPAPPEGTAVTTGPVAAGTATATDTMGVFPDFTRDPFLDGNIASTERTTTTARPAFAPSMGKEAKAPPPPPPARAWPKVIYKGTIRAHGDPNSTVAFLAVEGRDVLLKQGHESNGISVVRMSADSIVLRWSGEERALTRK